MNDLRRGLLAAAPLAPGIAVFGFLYGMLARQAGLTPFQAWGMSMTVFAGSAQFVAVGMWPGSTALPIILTTFVVNLRHLLLGLSIGTYFHDLPRRRKIPLAFWLTDEAYAVAIAEYRRGNGNSRYYLGAALSVYLVWPIAGLTGALVGTALPDPSRWGLDLVFPLTFLGLLVGFLEDRTSILIAVMSGAIALVAAQLLPGSWYVIIAGILGSTLGLALEHRREAS